MTTRNAFCVNCGKDIPPNVRFCPSCGALAEPSAPSQVSTPLQITASKKPSIKLLSVLIVVFILGAALGGASRSGGTATVTQTVQLQTTYTSLSTITQGANATEYASAALAIISQVRDIDSNTSANLKAFSSGQMSQADLLTFITQQKDTISVLTDSAMRLQPPPSLIEANVHFVKALSLLYSAFQLIEDGLIQNSVVLITEANALLTQSNNELNTANSILNSTI